MDNVIDFKAVASQLSKPEGEVGVRIAEQMNTSNADMTRQAVDHLDCKNHEQVLEIGPGNGRFAAYVLSKGSEVAYTGVDISETMVTTARKINKTHIDAGRVAFQHVNGLYLPFPDGAFNKIFTVNTLYFWKDPAIQLAEIKRVLKPLGTFCLAIASKAFMEQLPFTAYGFTLYTSEEAQRLLTANGFDLLDTKIRKQKIIGAAKQEVVREEVFILAK